MIIVRNPSTTKVTCKNNTRSSFVSFPFSHFSSSSYECNKNDTKSISNNPILRLMPRPRIKNSDNTRNAGSYHHRWCGRNVTRWVTRRSSDHAAIISKEYEIAWAYPENLIYNQFTLYVYMSITLTRRLDCLMFTNQNNILFSSVNRSKCQ